jgi:hypothetical protein
LTFGWRCPFLFTASLCTHNHTRRASVRHCTCLHFLVCFLSEHSLNTKSAPRPVFCVFCFGEQHTAKQIATPKVSQPVLRFWFLVSSTQQQFLQKCCVLFFCFHQHLFCQICTNTSKCKIGCCEFFAFWKPLAVRLTPLPQLHNVNSRTIIQRLRRRHTQFIRVTNFYIHNFRAKEHRNVFVCPLRSGAGDARVTSPAREG